MIDDFCRPASTKRNESGGHKNQTRKYHVGLSCTTEHMTRRRIQRLVRHELSTGKRVWKSRHLKTPSFLESKRSQQHLHIASSTTRTERPLGPTICDRTERRTDYSSTTIPSLSYRQPMLPPPPSPLLHEFRISAQHSATETSQ